MFDVEPARLFTLEPRIPDIHLTLTEPSRNRAGFTQSRVESRVVSPYRRGTAARPCNPLGPSAADVVVHHWQLTFGPRPGCPIRPAGCVAEEPSARGFALLLLLLLRCRLRHFPSAVDRVSELALSRRPFAIRPVDLLLTPPVRADLICCRRPLCRSLGTGHCPARVTGRLVADYDNRQGGGRPGGAILTASPALRPIASADAAADLVPAAFERLTVYCGVRCTIRRTSPSRGPMTAIVLQRRRERQCRFAFFNMRSTSSSPAGRATCAYPSARAPRIPVLA